MRHKDGHNLRACRTAEAESTGLQPIADACACLPLLCVQGRTGNKMFVFGGQQVSMGGRQPGSAAKHIGTMQAQQLKCIWLAGAKLSHAIHMAD